MTRITNKLVLLAFLTVVLSFFAAAGTSIGAGVSTKDAYERYLSDYNELKSAIDKGVDTETLNSLAEKYRTSYEIYSRANSAAVDQKRINSADMGASEDDPASNAQDISNDAAKTESVSNAPKYAETADQKINDLKKKIEAAADPSEKSSLMVELAIVFLKYKNDGVEAQKLLNNAAETAKSITSKTALAGVNEKLAKLSKIMKLRAEISVRYMAMRSKKDAFDAQSWLNPAAKGLKKIEYQLSNAKYKKALADYSSALDGKNIVLSYFKAGDPTRFESKTKFLFILLDGVRQDRFKELLDAGKLPNIQNLISNGVYVETGVSVLPSTTGPAYAPFIMGVGPTKSKLSGIRLFDRKTGTYRVYCGTDNSKINDDLTTEYKTIYEILSDKATLSVFGMVDRGVSKSGVPWIQVAYNKIKKDYNDMDASLVGKFLSETKNGLPVFSFISLHSPDSNGHSYGAGKEYSEAIIFEDSMVAKIVDHLKSIGEWGRVNIVISSDHGLATSNKSYDIDAALAKDLNMNSYHSIPRNTIDFNLLKSRFKADIITAVSGNACVLVYAKKPGAKNFIERPTANELKNYPDRTGKKKVDLIGFFAKSEGIRHVLYRDGSNCYFVESASGRSKIIKNGEQYSYSVIEGVDPFGYASDKKASALAGGAFHSSDEWLQATAGNPYPDVPVLVSDLLDSGCGGDMVLLAAPDYEPWNEGQKGLHGNLSYDQMKVPILFYGPAFKNGVKIECARTVDIFPTMLKALERPIPEKIDGKLIEGALK